MTITSERILITPEIAQQLLDKNKQNRPLNHMHVKHLAREMESGRWKENGDTIRLSNDILIDGQHRLAACISSKHSFHCMQISGLPDDAFDTVDCGRKRSPADVLAVLGESHCSALGAALKFIERYMIGNIGAGTRMHYSNAEIPLFLKKHPQIKESVSFVAQTGTKRLIAGSVLTGLHYLFAKLDKEAADEFVKKLIHGTDLKEGDAIYLLRERLVANSFSKARILPDYAAALAIKAWNFTRSGKTCKQLKYIDTGDSAEDFPLIR